MSDSEDDRILCKYGAECYQKNPAHHQKYKHPKKRVRSPSEKNPKKTKVRTPKKKQGTQLKRSPKKQKTVTGSHNDISDDSESEPSTKRPKKPKQHRPHNRNYKSDDSDSESSMKHPKKKPRQKNSPQKPKTVHVSEDSDSEPSTKRPFKKPKQQHKPQNRNDKNDDYDSSMKKPKQNSPQKPKTVHNVSGDSDSEPSSKPPPKKIKHENSPQKPDTSHNDISDIDSDESSKRDSSKKHTNTPTKEPESFPQDPKISDCNDENKDENPKEPPEFNITDEQLVELTEIVENKSEWLESKKKIIKKFFLVDMPDDFYQFWDFCNDIDEKNPKCVFDLIGLTLIGPFDVLASKKVTENTTGEHLLHWRYYFDPPEFQTILKGNIMEYHIGYFRDSPDDAPCFLAENNSAKDCIIKPIGANIFAAVNMYCDDFISRTNPFKRMELLKFQKRLRDKAKELGWDLRKISNSKRYPVCKSFHKAGIVVPFDKKTDLGYRPLSVDDKELNKICERVSKAPEESKSKAMSALQPVITAATIAIDECDFGTGLELGINLFCYGNEYLDSTALRMLTSAYSVLNRHAFIEIAKAHLTSRKKGMPHVVNY